MDDEFTSLALIDIRAKAGAVTMPWLDQTLTTVNEPLLAAGWCEAAKSINACATGV
jgi:hypothetical protein